MPLNKLSQKSFVNGQYDRSAQNQESVSGTGVVARGLSYAKNVLSSDKGELRKRLGTKLLKELGGSAVLVPFRMPDGDDVVISCGANDNPNENKIIGYKYINGQLEKLVLAVGTSVAFPANNTWANGAFGENSITNGNWNIGFSFDFDKTPVNWTQQPQCPGFIINGNGTYNVHSVRWYQGYACYNEKQSAPQYIVIHNSVDAVCMRSIKMWFYKASGYAFEYSHWTNPVIEYSDDGETWTGVQTTQKVNSDTPYGFFDKVTSPDYPALWVGRRETTISQTNYAGNHQYWRIYFAGTGTINAIAIADVDFIDVSQSDYFVENSPYTSENLKNIKYSQDKNIMFITCEGVSPYKLENNTGQLTLTQFTPMINTDSVWTLNGGYPSAVSMFQNRVWFGGFETEPAKVIASKFDDYNTFAPSSPLSKDDALDLTCNQLKNKIRNLAGGQNVLCCFSEDGISYIDGGSTGLLATNENIEFRLKNRMPAGSSTPGFKDDIMLYSSSDGTKLYGVDYDLLVNRFQVSDLAIYAKDVTQDKITELHYLNNESKLVYGLTESGKMFALLYEKGAFQGFFPLDLNGYVYDICPIKVGRSYKLLVVVNRSGGWFIEEKLDLGHYIDTSTPRLTGEEKKWATYDNLENNIALDCYQTYDASFDCGSRIVDTTHIISDVDLRSYYNKTVMLGSDNEKDFVVVTPEKYLGANINLDVSLGSHQWLSIAYGNGTFVALTGYTGYTSTSTDGINWTTPVQNIDSQGWYNVAYGNGKFVTVDAMGYVSTSVDGVTWETAVQDANLGLNSWRGLTYDGSKFIAIGTDGYISDSVDGTTWSVATSVANLGQNGWKSIAYGNGIYVALSSDGYVSTSTDGTNWSVATQQVSLWDNVWYLLSDFYWESLIYDGEKFVALNRLGYVSTSLDGETWTDAKRNYGLSGTGRWMGITYGNGKYCFIRYNGRTATAESAENLYQVTTESRRGVSTAFSKAYPEFTTFKPNLPLDVSVGIISEGRYFNTPERDEEGNITLPSACHKVIYGIIYESVAILKIQTPYESLKSIAQVDVSVIDTTHLEIGTSFDDTQNIERIDDSSYYDLTRITMNDTYRIVVSDTPEMTKNVILRSNKGVPFTVNAVDVYIQYSNLGGN